MGLGEERLTLLQSAIVSFIPSTVEDAETMHDGASEECLVLSVFVAPPLASRVVRRCVLPHGLWAHSFQAPLQAERIRCEFEMYFVFFSMFCFWVGVYSCMYSSA